MGAHLCSRFLSCLALLLEMPPVGHLDHAALGVVGDQVLLALSHRVCDR
jgi:hypothetical protein